MLPQPWIAGTGGWTLLNLSANQAILNRAVPVHRMIVQATTNHGVGIFPWLQRVAWMGTKCGRLLRVCWRVVTGNNRAGLKVTEFFHPYPVPEPRDGKEFYIKNST